MKKLALLLSSIVFFISAHAQAPPNDDPCGAIDIPVMAAEPILTDCVPTTVYSYLNASLTLAIPNPTCGASAFSQNIRDVWYKFTVPTSGVFLVNTFFANVFSDYTMAIYSSTSCNGIFTQISCNDDYNGIYPRIQGNGIAGQTLYVRIFRFTSGVFSDGDFKMCISDYSINNNPVVDNTTKVGIGTTNPLAKLDVAGTGLFRDKVTFVKDIELRVGLKLSPNAGVNKILTSDASGNASWLPPIIQPNYWNLTGSNIHNNNAGGNVGIGTNSPTNARLVIAGIPSAEGIDLASTDQYANMRVIRNNLFGLDKDMFIGYGSGANSSLHLYSNNIETITAKNANVGIGNSDPAYLLDISKRIRLRSESTSFGAGIWFNKNDNSSENIFLGNDVSNNLQVYSLIGSRTIASFNPSTGGFRVEGPVAANSGNFIASFGGNGDFIIDKLGQVGGRLTIKENGAIAVGGAANTGTAGQVLTSNGGGSSPKWQNPIVQSANTFPGYTNPTAITSTAITDIIGSVLTITTPIGVTTRLFYSCDFELVSNGCTGFNCSPDFSFQLMVDGVVKQLKFSSVNASDSRQVAFSNVAVDVSGGSHTIKIVVNKFDDENNCNVYLQNASVFALPQ